MIHTATIKIKVVLGEPLAATTPAPTAVCRNEDQDRLGRGQVELQDRQS